MPDTQYLKPGIRLGSYPQKQESRLNDLEQRFSRAFKSLQHKLNSKAKSQHYIVKKINQYQTILNNSSELELTKNIQQLRYQLHKQGLEHALIFKAFAVIREVADRTLNQRHYDEQLFGGWIMINGQLAEMQTGEGKTLATTLPSCTAALAGIPVHVITANDYLAARDAKNMFPLYQRLGLTSLSVIDGMETKQRQSAYQANIVHTTNKQITFDYLRDRIVLGDDTGALRFKFKEIQRDNQKKSPLFLRGLCFALIDEADSILIDEAKTPLIITKNKPNDELPETYQDALFLASALFIKQDYIVNSKSRKIDLTLEGEEKLIKLIKLISSLPKTWERKQKREMLVKQALVADYFYKKNKHYIINKEKVQIVDEYTGRIMSDRSWELGLQQMIEAKEGCLLSEAREPIARISYQRFFSRYLRVGGTSGTLSEVSAELQQVYGLQVSKVTTHKKCQRTLLMEQIYRNDSIKKRALLERVTIINQQHRPILIGTSSVEESEQVSQWLNKVNLPHRVLNAKQNQHEADIIAQAGQPDSITVATNMAGRGTDIYIPSSIVKLGGLHVISFSHNESKRLDRQLYGRCARQGDLGSAEAILSLQDSRLEHFYSSAMLKLLATFCPDNKPMSGYIGKWVLRFSQQRNEKKQWKIRQSVQKQDRHLRRILAFSGKFE